jgi:hypothetical protein
MKSRWCGTTTGDQPDKGASGFTEANACPDAKQSMQLAGNELAAAVHDKPQCSCAVAAQAGACEACALCNTMLKDPSSSEVHAAAQEHSASHGSAWSNVHNT